MRQGSNAVWNNVMSRVSVRLFINMLIPLMLGLFIYLTSGNNTYLSDFASSSGIQLIKIQYPGIVRFYLCDLLWGYSLYSGLRIFNDNAGVALLTAVITASVMEALQMTAVIPGTFDVWDIAVEIIGIILALLTTNFITGRKRDEETENH